MTGQQIIRLIITLKEAQDKYEPEVYWKTYRTLRGLFYKSNEWRRLRNRVRRESKHCYYNPRHFENLDVHHLVFIYQDPSLALTRSNLVTACRRCHRKVHNG